MVNAGDAETIRVLEEALKAAKEGVITSVAVLSANSSGFFVAVGGSQVVDLNLAADVLKARIVEVYLDPAKASGAPKAKSAILRPHQGRG